MPDLGPPDAWTAFAMRVFEVNGLLIAAGESIARPVGQTSARWRVLGRLHEPRTVPDLARDIGIARQAVQRTADALARDGLVDIQPHPSDQRTRLVSLTAQGAQVVRDLYRAQSAWSQRVTAALDERVLSRSVRDLAVVAELLRHHIDAPHVHQEDHQ